MDRAGEMTEADSAAASGSEPTPQEYSKPPSLLDNRTNGGENPTNRPTQTQPRRPLPTIGTRGQERGEA